MARDLVGKLVLRATDEGVAAVRLVEVEAYLGVEDPAAHTYRGRRTARVAAMWGEAGHAYVYFVYGMHHCLNVVTVGPEVPHAVLLRAGVPVVGESLMRSRRGGTVRRRALADGPAKLCQALDIDRADNGVDLCRRDNGLWLADDGHIVPDAEVDRTPRIGIAYAGEAASWPLRFLWSP